MVWILDWKSYRMLPVSPSLFLSATATDTIVSSLDLNKLYYFTTMHGPAGYSGWSHTEPSQWTASNSSVWLTATAVQLSRCWTASSNLLISYMTQLFGWLCGVFSRYSGLLPPLFGKSIHQHFQKKTVHSCVLSKNWNIHSSVLSKYQTSIHLYFSTI